MFFQPPRVIDQPYEIISIFLTRNKIPALFPDHKEFFFFNNFLTFGYPDLVLCTHKS